MHDASPDRDQRNSGEIMDASPEGKDSDQDDYLGEQTSP